MPVFVRRTSCNDAPLFFPFTRSNEKNVDLTRYIFETADGNSRCPYCVRVHSDSRNKLVDHMKRIHEDQIVRGSGYCFVPCLSICTAHAKKRIGPPSVHYHCRCGIIFMSTKGLTAHLGFGACRAKSSGSAFNSVTRSVPVPGFGALDLASPETELLPCAEEHVPTPGPVFDAINEEDEAMAELECEVQRNESSLDYESETEELRWKTNERCRLCDLKFVAFRDLVDHMREEHPTSKMLLPVNLMCTICGMKVGVVDQLAVHYRDEHKLADCQIKSAVFRDAVEFYAWKSDIEVKTYSNFAKRRRYATDQELELFFSCSSSWGDNRTSLRVKRMERHCAAFIKVTQNRSSPSVSVTYCLGHLGHNVEEDEFWKSVKKSLHGQISFQRHKTAATSNRQSTIGVNLIGTATARRMRTLRNRVPFDLDEKVSVYWDIMREKVEDSGFYAMSISGRWAVGGNNLCGVCQLELKTRKSLTRHMLRFHGPKRAAVSSKFGRPVRCLFCNLEMPPPGMKNLIHHYISAHEQPIHFQVASFTSLESFNNWRENVSAGALRRHKCYKAANGDVRQYWTCKCSGKLRNPLAGVSEGHCPAWIFSEESVNPITGQKSIKVSYCLSHIGHVIAESRQGKFPLRQLTTTSSPMEAVGDSYPNGVSSSAIALSGAETAATSTSMALEECMAHGVVDTVSMRMDNGIGGDNECPISTSCVIDSGVALAASLRNPMVSVTDAMDVHTLNQEDGVVDAAGFNFGVLHEQSGPISGFLAIENTGRLDTAAMRAMSPVQAATFGSPTASAVANPGQIEVLIRSVSGQERSVKLPLGGFPLVEKGGRVYYALDGTSLVEALSQMLSRQGQCLYEGDRVTVLRASSN